MRQQYGPGLSKRIFAGLAALAALAPPAWGYVNGGTYHNTLRNYEKRLKAEGWGFYFGAPMAGAAARGAAGTAFVPPGDPGHQRYVNELVGRALRSLPGKEADEVPLRPSRRSPGSPARRSSGPPRPGGKPASTGRWARCCTRWGPMRSRRTGRRTTPRPGAGGPGFTNGCRGWPPSSP
jgi:hypothetical protein